MASFHSLCVEISKVTVAADSGEGTLIKGKCVKRVGTILRSDYSIVYKKRKQALVFRSLRESRLVFRSSIPRRW